MDAKRTIVIAWLQSGLDAFCRPKHEPKAAIWTTQPTEDSLHEAKMHALEHLHNNHPLVFESEADDPLREAKQRMANAYALDYPEEDC